MNYRKTVLQFGSLTIEVVCETLEDLIREVSYINNLNRAGEGRDCMPFFEHRGGYDFFGFRDEKGAEVTFGKEANPSDPARPYFAWNKGAKTKKGHGYKGFQRPQLPEANGGEPEVNGQAVSKPKWDENLKALYEYLDKRTGNDAELREGIRKSEKQVSTYPENVRERALEIIGGFKDKLEESRKQEQAGEQFQQPEFFKDPA